jgi:carboxy-terminal domain RNA polymerase II polypeptide A small phosphatase
MSRDLIDKPQDVHDSSREKEIASAGDGSSTKKGRLLKVPSRSSSKKRQSSPTSTGLSGVTVSESRDSIGGRSKESKASIMGRHRNGSVSSNRSAVDTSQAANHGNSVQNSSAPVPRKKKGGLLSLFCCGVPDDAHPLDNEPGDAPTHKVEKLPPRPTTASRRAQTPSEHTAASKSQAQEKDVAQTQNNPPEPSRAQRVSGTATQDQSTLAEESKQSTLIGTAPTVTVEPPRSQEAEAGGSASEAPAKDEDGDAEMVDAAALQAPEPPQPADAEDLPHPPVPVPDAPIAPKNEAGLVVATEQAVQDALLPPIQPHFKGRKCLVLDLDETLVHSSFKASSYSEPVAELKR